MKTLRGFLVIYKPMQNVQTALKYDIPDFAFPHGCVSMVSNLDHLNRKKAVFLRDTDLFWR